MVAAQGGSQCEQDPFCLKIDNPGNQGYQDAPEGATLIWKFVIKAGNEEYAYYPYSTGDSCYRVGWDTDTRIRWQKIGQGPTCKDISHIQLWWQGEQATPTATTPGETPTPPGETPPPPTSTPPGETPTPPPPGTVTPPPPTATPPTPGTPTPPPPPTVTPPPPGETPVPQYSASWKANFLKFGQHLPVPGVIVLRGQYIETGWSWHSMGEDPVTGGWEDSYMSHYTPVVLTQPATAVEAFFWPYGVEEWQVRLIFHESNTWNGNPNFGTLGNGDEKSLEVGLPDDWQPPTKPDWWGSIWWNPAVLNSHFYTWGTYHQAGNWPPQ